MRALSARLWRPIAVACAAVVLAAGALLLTRSSVFHVRRVEVDGAVHLSRAEVVRRSGITRSDNAIWLDEGDAEARLATNPWVARVVVEVNLPWTVTLSVTERSPIAVLERGTVKLLVAADGTLLGPAGRVDLPVIEAPPPWVGDEAGTPVQAIARALGSLAPEVRAAVRRIEYTSPAGLQLFLSDGVRITYGAARGFDAKSAVITDVLAWVEVTGERIRSVNVSAPGMPAVALTA